MLKNDKGFSLIELVVVAALMTIVSAFSVASYVSVAQERLEAADYETLNDIDTNLYSLVAYEDVWDELTAVADTAGQVRIAFTIRKESKGSIAIKTGSTINETSQTLEDTCPCLSEYLGKVMSFPLQLKSKTFSDGKYIVTIQLNRVQIGIHEASFANDEVIITSKYVKN